MFRRFGAVLLAVAAILFFAVAPGHAVLKAVGPTSSPVPPGDGFPLWYQDTTNLVLDLCLPDPGPERDGGYCLTLPADFPAPLGPVVFPTNYAAEGFWWSAGTIIPLPGGGTADLVLALEAAFSSGEVPINGDQVAFGRVRVRIDAGVEGTYTVTYPYGVLTFDVSAADIAAARAINFTSDIGIGNPGDFTGALQSAVGPFLVAADCVTGVQQPFFADLAIPGKQYLADPALPTCVIGGNQFNTTTPNVNTFRVVGPADAFGQGVNTVETNQFNITGRRFLGTPIVIDRATYTRNAAGAVAVDVFGTAGLAATSATATSGAVVDQVMAGVGANRLFTHMELGVVPVPASASITATAVDPFVALVPPGAPTNLLPTTVSAGPLQDLVTITTAQYNLATNQLTILASSSDQDPVNGPTLTEQYLQSLVPPVPLVNGVVTTVSGVLVPPAELVVNSTAGGAVTKPVDIVSIAATGVVGFFRDGSWILDLNGNGVMEATDFSYTFGTSTDIPVVGDWDGSGKSRIGVFRNGDWIVDYNGNGRIDTCVTPPAVPGPAEDLCMPLGQPGDVPVVGKWTGAGASKIGVFRNGDWYLDYNGNGKWDGCPVYPDSPTVDLPDLCLPLGQPGDIPVVGDWNGNGTSKIGVFRNGDWFIDYNGNGKWDGCVTAPAVPGPTEDLCAPLGQPGDVPVVADWDRSDLSIASKIGVVRAGVWYLDMDGNGAWSGEPADKVLNFGAAGDKPVTGNW